MNKIRQISNCSTSRNKNRLPRLKRIMESALLSNGNMMEFPEPGDSQGFSQTRAREEAGRLQKSIRNLKGMLTKEVNQCNDKIAHFKSKFAEDYTTITVVKTNYAQSTMQSTLLKSREGLGKGEGFRMQYMAGQR